MENQKKLKILITSPNASIRFGGEAILPYHYFRLLNQNHYETFLVTHSRCQTELEELLPHLKSKMIFIHDNKIDLFVYQLTQFPVVRVFFDWIFTLMYIFKQRRFVKKLVKEKQIDIVHEVVPVSPKLPSSIFNVGAPVIIGPLNGGMEYPPSFKHLESRLERIMRFTGRLFSPLMNHLIPGKLRASLLLASNNRTIEALSFSKAPKHLMIENGVDSSIWNPKIIEDILNGSRVKIYFIGRLVPFKGVNYLLKAFDRINCSSGLELHIIGEGNLRTSLEKQASDMKNKVFFHGHVPWNKIAEQLEPGSILVLPSLFDCGGAVILEGMLCGLAIVATAWGGALDYLDNQCGILIRPDDEEQFIRDLANAMQFLIESPAKRIEMGKYGQEKVMKCFTWQTKIDQISEIYQKISEDVDLST